MSEWSDRLPGYDAWKTTDHRYRCEEEDEMTEREAEEKRDAEIRSGVAVSMRPIADFDVDDKAMRVEINEDGAVVLRGEKVHGKAVFTAVGWDRICYAVERAREETR